MSTVAVAALVGAGSSVASSASAAAQPSSIRPQCCNEWHWEYYGAYNQGVSGWGACAVDGQALIKNSFGQATKYNCVQHGGTWFAPIIDLYMWTTFWR